MALIDSFQTGDYDVGATWVGGAAPGAGDTPTIKTGHVVTQTQNEACTTIAVEAGGAWDQATFNMACSNGAGISGTHIMGVSAGTGLTCVGYLALISSTIDWNTLSKINNSGLISIAAGVFANMGRGEYIQTASANVEMGINNFFYSFTLNAGQTITATGNCYFTCGGLGSINTDIKGIINIGAFILRLGANQTGALLFDTNCDIQGNGTLLFCIRSGATLTVNKTTLFGFIGTVNGTAEVVFAYLLPSGDWRNANFQLQGSALNLSYALTDSQITRCKDFITTNANTGIVDMYLTGAGFTPTLQIYGDVKNNEGVGTFEVNWVKGTNPTSLLGAAANTFEWNTPDDLGDIIVNSTGSHQMIDAMLVTSLTGTAGEWDFNGQNITTTANFTSAAAFTYVNIGGRTLTVGGNFTVAGAVGNLVDFNPASVWYLNVTGNSSVVYANVKNSDASGGATISADDNTSLDLGNNINWDFYPAGAEISSDLGLNIHAGFY